MNNIRRKDTFCIECGIDLPLGQARIDGDWVHYCDRCDRSWTQKTVYQRRQHCTACAGETLHTAVLNAGTARMICDKCQTGSNSNPTGCGWCATGIIPCAHCLQEEGGEVITVTMPLS